MSSTLYWRPVSTGESLPQALKFKLRDRFDLVGGYKVDRYSKIYAYLQGLADAEIEGAQTVLDAVDEYGTVILETKH